MSRFLKFVNSKKETIDLVNVDQIVSVSVDYDSHWDDKCEGYRLTNSENYFPPCTRNIGFRYPKTIIATTGDLGCLDYQGDLNHQIDKALRSEERVYVILVDDLGYEEAKEECLDKAVNDGKIKLIVKKRV